jgi:hypothetical protein
VICSKFGIDRSRGFQSADPRKSAFPTESFHRLYNIALCDVSISSCDDLLLLGLKEVHDIRPVSTVYCFARFLAQSSRDF